MARELLVESKNLWKKKAMQCQKPHLASACGQDVHSLAGDPVAAEVLWERETLT